MKYLPLDWTLLVRFPVGDLRSSIARLPGYGLADVHLVSLILSLAMETRSGSLIPHKRTVCGVYITAVCVFHGEGPRQRSDCLFFLCHFEWQMTGIVRARLVSDHEGTTGCTLTLSEHENYLSMTYIKFGSYLTRNFLCLSYKSARYSCLGE
jgi:hypothetical protein